MPLNTNIAISVIIPVYNAAQYLSAALASVLGQNIENIEVICVDDGSTDESSFIIEEHVNSDPRVSLISHAENRGEGASRNSGILAAKGDYIFNLDADDTLPPKALSMLYEEAQAHDCDLIKGTYSLVYEDGLKQIATWATTPARVVKTNIWEFEFLRSIPSGHTSGLYKREFLLNQKLLYPEDLSLGADLVFLSNVYMKAKSVTLIPDVVYYYNLTPDSACRSNMTLKKVLDATETKRKITQLLGDAGFNISKDKLLANWGWNIRYCFIGIAHSLSDEDCSLAFSGVRQLTSLQSPPWSVNTPPKQKYLLALILHGKDQQALEQLRDENFLDDFVNRDGLLKCLFRILELMPEDPEAHYAIGDFMLEERQYNFAIEKYESTSQMDAENIPRAVLLEKLKLAYEDPRPIIDSTNFELILNKRQKLNKLRLDAANLRLDAANKKLSNLKSSRSWKLTEPLRHFSSQLKGLRTRIFQTK